MIGNLEDDVIDGIVARFGPRVTRINLSSNGLRSLGNIERISPVLEKLNLSQNDLVDVRPLARLVTLTDLNLAENSIADVSALASLPLLQHLDLTGNNIATVASLSILSSHLLQLKSLQLDGNPVCSVLGYPHPVLSLFPSLESLDGVSRQGGLGADAGGPLALSAQSQVRDSSSATSPSSSSSSSSSLVALREQLDTMERAFDMQERALTSSGLDAARQLLSAPEGLLADDEVDAAGGDGKAAVESFPYLKLLQLWRKKALESMTQLALVQKKLQNTMATLKEARTRHGNEIKAQQLATLSYKEKCAATSDKAVFWEGKVDEVEGKLAQELKYRSIIDRERLDGQFKLRGLRAFLERAKSQLEEEALAGMMRVDQAARKLKSFESRLLQAAERVQFAATLVAQKEVVLRNSAAASEAVRRLQAVASGGGARGGAGRDEDADDSSAAPPLLSDLVLKPEVESLLRTIFRKLDDGESGTVSAQVLQSCLLAEEGGEDEGAGGSEVMEGDGECTKHVGALVRNSLGPAQWRRLTRGVSSLAPAASVTWGEFLLFLLPRAAEDEPAALCASELEELRSAGIWGDAEWGLVPLALPKDFSSAAFASIQHQQHQQPISAEVRRLLAERKFLMERVQEMGRTLERRAEAVKGHFKHELQRARLKESHLQSQVAELRAALESAETRLHDAADAHGAIHKASTERLLAVEKELADARQALAARKDQATQSLEAAVLEEKAKFTRLETEHNLLQREMGKKEIKCKGLQRDVMRLQAQQAQQADDKARADLELDNEKAELQSLKDAWASEKQALEERIAELVARAATAGAGGGGGGGGDEIDSVRQQIQVLRAMPPPPPPPPQQQQQQEQQEQQEQQLRKLVSAGGLGQTDVYAAHLNKLLRLAEEAISKTH